MNRHFLLFFALGACGEDVPAECEELGDLCHEAGDAGDTEAEACHEYAHEEGRTAEECSVKRIECEAACTSG